MHVEPQQTLLAIARMLSVRGTAIIRILSTTRKVDLTALTAYRAASKAHGQRTCHTRDPLTRSCAAAAPVHHAAGAAAASSAHRGPRPTLLRALCCVLAGAHSAQHGLPPRPEIDDGRSRRDLPLHSSSASHPCGQERQAHGSIGPPVPQASRTGGACMAGRGCCCCGQQCAAPGPAHHWSTWGMQAAAGAVPAWCRSRSIDCDHVSARTAIAAAAHAAWLLRHVRRDMHWCGAVRPMAAAVGALGGVPLGQPEGPGSACCHSRGEPHTASRR